MTLFMDGGDTLDMVITAIDGIIIGKICYTGYMKIIRSVQNELIKKIVKLKTSKERQEQRLFLVEGQRTVEAFSHAGWKPRELFVIESLLEQAVKLFSCEPTLVSDHVMEKISSTATPSGIVAVFPLPQEKQTKLTKGLVLSDISDPGNMGTLIRSSAAFGYKTIVIIGGCDPYSPKVIQASAGALAHVTLVQLTWSELLQKKENLKLCALVVKGGIDRLQDLAKKSFLLVVGNEAHGLSKEQVADCDIQFTLPMNESTESLNAAVAGSIALFLLS